MKLCQQINPHAVEVEVEIRFKVESVEATQTLLLKNGALMVNDEITIHDIYYDDTSTMLYPLVKNDIWVRKRNGAWEIKLKNEALNEGTSRRIEGSGENFVKREIAKLGLSLGTLRPFAEYISKRRILTHNYKNQRFTIVLDSAFTMDGQEFYKVGEVEQIKTKENQSNQTETLIQDYIHDIGLPRDRVCSKMKQYLKFNQHHYS
eukprot:UC4_evm1s799